MKIYIPTRGRVNTQTTLENLPGELLPQTIIVCPSKEVKPFQDRYKKMGVEVVQQPDDNMNISDKRKWIVFDCKDDKMVMLDDDLRFAVRREDDDGKFLKATDDQILQAFHELSIILSEKTPHAGFAVRGMSIGERAREGGWQEAKRMIYSLGYYLPIVKYWAEFGRVRTHEDIDITLQLLSMGFPNLVNFSFVCDQKFGSSGGCSDERTIQINNEDCQKLVELHPDYVTASEKVYLNSPTRIEVRCQWQKALEDGIQFRKFWLETQKSGN